MRVTPTAIGSQADRAAPEKAGEAVRPLGSMAEVSASTTRIETTTASRGLRLAMPAPMSAVLLAACSATGGPVGCRGIRTSISVSSVRQGPGIGPTRRSAHHDYLRTAPTIGRADGRRQGRTIGSLTSVSAKATACHAAARPVPIRHRP